MKSLITRIRAAWRERCRCWPDGRGPHQVTGWRIAPHCPQHGIAALAARYLAEEVP